MRTSDRASACLAIERMSVWPMSDEASFKCQAVSFKDRTSMSVVREDGQYFALIDRSACTLNQFVSERVMAVREKPMSVAFIDGMPAVIYIYICEEDVVVV